MFLYVMECQDMVKVGFSKNPHRRRNALTHGPWPVRLISACEIGPDMDHRECEAECHEWLKEFHHHGEWFRMNAWCAVTVMEHCAAWKHDVAIVHTVCDLALAGNEVPRDEWRLEEISDELREWGWEHYDRCFGTENNSIWTLTRAQKALLDLRRPSTPSALKRAAAKRRAENVEARNPLTRG